MNREVVFNAELGCSFHSIEVYPGKDNLLVYWCEGVPNMRSCIELSKAIYPEVKTILCKDEVFGRTTAYFFQDGEWEARSVR